jgi:hypothetical protein
LPTPRLAFFTIVATLAYLGLAILGWGGFEAFFSNPARIALAIVVFVLSGVALFGSGNLSPGECEDRANRWVIAAFALIGLLLAYTRIGRGSGSSTGTPFVGLASFSLRRVVRCDSGQCLCSAVGSAGWLPFSPGIRWSPAVSMASSVIPVYLGLLVSSLGWALAFRSGGGVLLTALLIPPLIARIGAEESLLRTQFGGEYVAYRGRTWRLISWNLLE